ncbi:MAG: OsmC family protein [Caldilineaceae bacterium]|nr:OsmC family protein [Caldilineaceae bacterium]
MPLLDAYLERKQRVLAERSNDYVAAPDKAMVRLTASSWVAGTTGARPVQMGQTRFISDAAPALAGNALGPTAPEMLLGALASCLVHTYLIQAALLDIPLDQVDVEVQGALDMRGVVGLPASSPPQMEQITYQARISSPAETQVLERLHVAVEETCPVLNTLRLPTAVARVPAA